jgi:putative spermidine/putrescine transport system permease protein
MVASLFTFLLSWSQYITTLLIGDGRVLTLPRVLFPFISVSNNAMMATISIIFVLPAIFALLLTSRMLNRDAAAMSGLGRQFAPGDAPVDPRCAAATGHHDPL